MDSIITILLDKIKQEYTLPIPKWKYKRIIPSSKWKWIQEECSKSSDFDTLRLRQDIIGKANQTHKQFYATCDYGSVSMITDDGIIPSDVPWELWGRIFRIFYKKTPISVYFLAHSSLRLFPSTTSRPILPENINGGYTYPCRSDTIVIYRAEDATRVLIHELQHACCLDDHQTTVDEIEAKTEAWAELIYTALLSKGDKKIWKILWNRQLAWISQQNRQIRKYMKIQRAFPWRYTLGKEKVLDQMLLWKEIRHEFTNDYLPNISLRLTAPPTQLQKIEQHIRQSSTIL